MQKFEIFFKRIKTMSNSTLNAALQDWFGINLLRLDPAQAFLAVVHEHIGYRKLINFTNFKYLNNDLIRFCDKRNGY